MPWFDDVQIFLIVILLVIGLNCVLFLIVAEKASGFHRRRGRSENEPILCSQFGLPPGGREAAKEKRVLFVLKDLSDLVLYFGPILFAVLRNSCEVFVLIVHPCSGERYDWLKNCASILCHTMCFPVSNVVFAWDERFPHEQSTADDPWPVIRLMQFIRPFCVAWDVDYIITYDAEGINEDATRQALNESVNGLWRKGLLPKGADVYLLTSASMFHSMAGLFGTPFSCLSSVSGVISTEFSSSLLEIFMLQRLYLLCEWRGVNRSWLVLVKTTLLLFCSRYFLSSAFHRAHEEDKYRL